MKNGERAVATRRSFAAVQRDETRPRLGALGSWATVPSAYLTVLAATVAAQKHGPPQVCLEVQTICGTCAGNRKAASHLPHSISFRCSDWLGLVSRARSANGRSELASRGSRLWLTAVHLAPNQSARLGAQSTSESWIPLWAALHKAPSTRCLLRWCILLSSPAPIHSPTHQPKAKARPQQAAPGGRTPP